MTSSAESTRTNRNARRTSFGISSRSASFSRGRIDRRDTGPLRCERLLLDAADRKNLTGEGDLSGHRDVLGDRLAGQQRHDRRCHRDAGGRPVLGNGSRRDVDVEVVLPEPLRIGCAKPAACARTQDSAACADSRITSPSCPVRMRLPLPGIAVASTKSTSPPVSVTARPVATPGSFVRLRVSPA